MILKKLKRTNLQKTKAAMIGGLVDYILAAKDEDGYQKLQFAYAKNVITTKPEAWKQEMIALAEESIHSKMPVTHWVMSWQENEVPTREQVKEAVGIFLEGMGLKDHQAIVAAHVNTANYHVHIVVNRVHPLIEKVVQPHKGFDIEAAHRIAAEIEHKQGWASNENARYRVNEQGQIARIQQAKVVKPKAKAADFENATGEKSAQRIAQEKGHAIIQKTTSWAELHAGLGKVGLRFVRKGSGAVIFVGNTAVKASSVDRNFGLSRLCKRLGEYEEGEYPAEMPCRNLSLSAMFARRNGASIRPNVINWPRNIVLKRNAAEKPNACKKRSSGRRGRLSLPGWLRTVCPCSISPAIS